MATNTHRSLLPLLLKTPPGQLKNVYTDIKGILSVGDELDKSARAIFEQHNHEQLAVVYINVEGAEVPVIIAQAARTPSGRYVSRRFSLSFAFDHVRVAASDVLPHAPLSGLAKELDEQLDKYVGDHYEMSASGVFQQEADEEPVEEPSGEGEAPEASARDDECPSPLIIHIVGNRYNLRNFWSGRWRSTYTYDPNAKTFTSAIIRVQAHYFEGGNVQLNTHNTTIPQLKEGAVSAAQLIGAIASHEQAYQESLDVTIESLRERAFRTLRRTLPFTKQKIDWDKAVGYKIGNELQGR